LIKKYLKSNQAKIIVLLWGGLGNQLFIYAAARRLAIINNAELIIDDISGFLTDIEYNRSYQLNHFNLSCRKANSAERLEPLPRFRRNLMRRWNMLKPFALRNYISQKNIDYLPDLMDFKVKSTVYMEGYWQGEDYFKDIEDIIRYDLQICPPNDIQNLNMALKINQRISVSVHIRNHKESKTIDINTDLSDYYLKAINLMEKLNLNAHYFIFSDEPKTARLQIPLNDDRITIVDHNQGDELAYADLWLMTQCKHFIIANSTFSWWGAWLSINKDKQIIAPKFEKRIGNNYWGFRGLLPEAWIKL
jgi:hypothetical protein